MVDDGGVEDVIALPLGREIGQHDWCLRVALKAEREGVPVFHETWAMDAWGDVRGTAMGRLVSVPVSLAIEAVLQREIPAGVYGAPHDPRLLSRWLDQVGHLAQYMARIDHLA